MTTLILLHGALGSAETLTSLENILSGEYNVLMPDFPGHGKNTGEDFGINAFAESLDRLIRDNNLVTYSIFGYSMGGYVALKFAAGNPKGLQQIITLGTKFDWTPESAAAEVKKLSPELIEEKVPKFAQSLNSLHIDWKSLMNKTAVMMLEMGNEGGLKRDLLYEIKIPVSLYRGSEDVMVTTEETKAVAEWLGNGAYIVLPGVQHPIDRVDPELIAGLIRKHIK